MKFLIAILFFALLAACGKEAEQLAPEPEAPAAEAPLELVLDCKLRKWSKHSFRFKAHCKVVEEH